MSTALQDSEINALRERLKSRFRALREEIRQELLASDDQHYVDLAGPVHDLEDQAVADLLVDVQLASIDRHLRELRDIDAALLRIGNNEYGVCIDCEAPIGTERLQANPAAARCQACQSRHEHTHPPGR